MSGKDVCGWKQLDINLELMKDFFSLHTRYQQRVERQIHCNHLNVRVIHHYFRISHQIFVLGANKLDLEYMICLMLVEAGMAYDKDVLAKKLCHCKCI